MLPTYRVKIVTLGCAKNEVDSDRMRAHIERCPAFYYVEADEAADVTIVNTCSFLVSAVAEGVELILSLVQDKADGVPCGKIVMSGCIPSRYGEQIEAEMPEVAAFVPVDEEDGITEVLARVCGIESLASYQMMDEGPLRTVRAATAYVMISDGCDRFCSFCAIPYIRGRYHSRPADEIIDEVRKLVAGGVREIVLIGQDTGIWGWDLPEEGMTLAWLMRRVAAELHDVHGWLRVLYLQPEGMTEDLIAVLRDCEEAVPYIDIPLQHCNAAVLERMNRTGSNEEFRELIVKLRREIPGVTLRTTVIAGFPGETDEEFAELEDFLEWAEFDYMAVFAYSQEEGTAAAELPGQVDEDVKLQRTQRLQDIAETYGFASAARRLGSRVRVLVDATEDDGEGQIELIGRACFQAPDSDGVIHLGQADVAMGDFVDVEIEDAACYELFGTVVSPQIDMH